MQFAAAICMSILASAAFVSLVWGFFKVAGFLADRLSRYVETHPRPKKVATILGTVAMIAFGLLVAFRAAEWGIDAHGRYTRAKEERELRERQTQFLDHCLEERAIRGIRSVDESCDEAATRVVR